MRMRGALPVVVLVMTSASVSSAQWIPATARITETVETIENGKITKVERREGYFYRNSEGSTLKYWERLNGNELPGAEGWLEDNKNLLSYSIRMTTKEAIQQSDKTREKPLSPAIYRFASASSLGDDFIAGIRCRRRPVVVIWPDGRRERVGENCISLEYALELRGENRVTQHGVTRHTIMELHDVQLGVEPDSKLFDVERTYTVFRQQPPKP